MLKECLICKKLFIPSIHHPHQKICFSKICKYKLHTITKKSKTCPKCNTNKIMQHNRLCLKCYGTTLVGVGNPAYRDGRTNNTLCLDCKRPLKNHRAKNQLCRACWIKIRIGYKHKKETIIKMKNTWQKNKKYIILFCKQCKKSFKIISWKTFRKFCSMKCHSNYNKGKKRPLQSKTMLGKNNPNWRGGLSFEPYTIEWNKQLKEQIRKRDGYKCQKCGDIQLNRKLYVHHINYIKKNCNPNNLISLCHSCHAKTNGKRDYWTKYFTNLLDIKNAY